MNMLQSCTTRTRERLERPPTPDLYQREMSARSPSKGVLFLSTLDKTDSELWKEIKAEKYFDWRHVPSYLLLACELHLKCRLRFGGWLAFKVSSEQVIPTSVVDAFGFSWATDNFEFFSSTSHLQQNMGFLQFNPEIRWLPSTMFSRTCIENKASCPERWAHPARESVAPTPPHWNHGFQDGDPKWLRTDLSTEVLTQLNRARC